jgi:demethylmenaquinone methyltransferase/2-methoxy-6-polyprenyl-1,4-benzoquinol methylase
MFDAIAGHYDLLNHLLSAGLDKRWRRQAIERLQLSGRERVLDLCTGTADLAITAVACTPGARRVIGIDFSSAMLQLGKAKTGEGVSSRARSIDLIRGDATRIPLRDASVDAATIGFGIRNVEHPDIACHELVRVLRRGGRLVILEFSLPRSATLRNFYLWYFRSILPRIGRTISRHPHAYSYLPESVETFPSPDEFAQQLRTAGFSSVTLVALTFGIVYMFIATKK